MVELIIMLSQKPKFKVIAEGVESTRQREQLLELGCELGQGNLFSPPVDAKTAEQLLRSRNAHAKIAGAQ
jgi:EAL domain-containing protein (putative c-di-GMP-specific phosphodiesterase class I)